MDHVRGGFASQHLRRVGLPIGMRIIGRPGSEAMVLRLGYTYEQARGVAQTLTNL